MTPLIKEVCNHCCGNIAVGQAIVECFKCDSVMHHKCYIPTNTDNSGNFLCKSCNSLQLTRYNPLKYVNQDDDDLDIEGAIAAAH